jgi:hypothetical protein
MMASSSWLGFFVTIHLLQSAVRERSCDSRVVSGQPIRRDLSKRQQLIRLDIVSLILREAGQKTPRRRLR